MSYVLEGPGPVYVFLERGSLISVGAFEDRILTRMCNSFTGINAEASQALTEKAHIYLTTNGRISMAGLNSKNIRYFAENLDKVVRGQL